jgi:dihydrofolate synthase/folylpolyglutamate synthase
VSNTIAKPQSVDAWLAYIEALHPKSIAMGLERVNVVAKRLALFAHKKPPVIITVAGTNGKGSTCAMLERVYIEAGYRVGCYTSPHLSRYHERVRVQAQEISDEALCTAFAAVESARGETELTYFEMGTLSALWHFSQLSLDVLVLEVGLGGRLDAVNILDADCAIVTNVDLDHMEYLGDTREKIGLEKAGIYRANQIAICGDRSPPNSLVALAKKIGAHLSCIQQAFDVELVDEGWQYRDHGGVLHFPQLSLRGAFQRDNAALVIYAVHALNTRLPVKDATLIRVLPTVQLIGRFQYLNTHPDIIIDVAHNPQAAQSLSENLAELQQNMPKDGRLIAVFAMLADKDIDAVVRVLQHQIDAWHVAELHHPRAAKLSELINVLAAAQVKVPVQAHPSIQLALMDACKNMTKNDKIIVFGSFFTVAAVLDHWQPHCFQS